MNQRGNNPNVYQLIVKSMEQLAVKLNERLTHVTTRTRLKEASFKGSHGMIASIGNVQNRQVYRQKVNKRWSGVWEEMSSDMVTRFHSSMIKTF